MKYGIPEQLHPATADLVERFAVALARKLYAAQVKYRYTDGWAATDWEDACRRELQAHMAKGDPLDVAAFAAFMWHHNWPTARPHTACPHANTINIPVTERGQTRHCQDCGLDL